jgi:hypothetical protein
LGFLASKLLSPSIGGITMNELIPAERIADRILFIRGQKVMVDKDLALLYGVSTKRLNEQVKRNLRRFPEDFMFKLTKEEAYKILDITGDSLRSQFATLKRGKHIKHLPYVFTEQGIAMLSTVLNSERAIDVNIAIMRIFVKFRQILSNNKELAKKLTELENRVESHDKEIQSIFEAMRQLILPPEKPKKRIGF